MKINNQLIDGQTNMEIDTPLQSTSPKLIGFLCPMSGSTMTPVFVPLDRTARNADDLYGWQPVYDAPVCVDETALVLARFIAEKFASGNAIPVERITITRSELERLISNEDIQAANS